MSKILTPEQLRPFLIGCLFTSGVIVVAHFLGAQAGYLECANDAFDVLKASSESNGLKSLSNE